MSNPAPTPDPPDPVADPVTGTPRTNPVAELCRLWLAAREAGNPVSLNDLCRDRPEPLGPLRKAVAALGIPDPDAIDTVPAPASLDAGSPAARSPAPAPARVGRFE